MVTHIYMIQDNIDTTMGARLTRYGAMKELGAYIRNCEVEEMAQKLGGEIPEDDADLYQRARETHVLEEDFRDVQLIIQESEMDSAYSLEKLNQVAFEKNLLIPPRGDVQEIEIEKPQLETLQEMVEGPIEAIYNGDLVMIINEEGKFGDFEVNPLATGLLKNKLNRRDNIVGPVVYMNQRNFE